MGICDCCGEERKLYIIGEYETNGKIEKLLCCQYCRASATKRKIRFQMESGPEEEEKRSSLKPWEEG